jgi:cytosine/adenosine deaminase-related metal-dependent hydrolase
MKRFSAQFVFTNSGAPRKRAVITVEDDGTIVSVSDNAGRLKEEHSTEFHNGIIIPGSSLNILDELRTLQSDFPGTAPEDLVKQASLNVSKAAGEQALPVIEAGTKPGLLVIQDVDLQNIKVMPESYITRLI